MQLSHHAKFIVAFMVLMIPLVSTSQPIELIVKEVPKEGLDQAEQVEQSNEFVREGFDEVPDGFAQFSAEADGDNDFHLLTEKKVTSYKIVGWHCQKLTITKANSITTEDVVGFDSQRNVLRGTAVLNPGEKEIHVYDDCFFEEEKDTPFFFRLFNFF